MALKSVFEVEVNDGAFRRFQTLFDRYQKALAKNQPAWGAIGREISGTATKLDQMTSRFTVGANLVLGMVRGTKQISSNVGEMTVKWGAMDRITLRVASNIKAATSSLLRWGAVTGVISGLIGAGGLFGIDRLALGVAAGRKSSLGLGVGYGEQRAFSTNFQRLIGDPDSFLASVFGAKTDITKRVGLIGAGLTQGEIGGSNADTAVALLKNLKRIADTTDPTLFEQTINSRRIGQFASAGDLQRLRDTSPAEIAELIARYQGNRGQFDLPPDVSRKWQEFTTQIARAGQGIENTFVRGLAPLAPALGRMSESFEKVVRSFLSSPALGEWIKKVGDGLESFAKYIGTEDFQSDVRGFAEGVGKIARAIGNALSWLGGSDPEVAEQRKRTSNNADQLRRDRAEGRATIWSQLGDALTRKSPAAQDDLLDMVRRAERSGDQAVSPKGAIGRYQIMPGTAQQYGFDPSRLTDPAYNEQVARAVLADLTKRYRGNVAEILAGYNAGPGRADKFAKSGDDISTLPAETRKYLVNSGYAQPHPVELNVRDTTGGNVNYSVNGLK